MSEHTYSPEHVAQAVLNAASLTRPGKTAFFPSELANNTELPKFAEEDFCEYLIETGLFERAGLSHFSLTEEGEKLARSTKR